MNSLGVSSCHRTGVGPRFGTKAPPHRQRSRKVTSLVSARAELREAQSSGREGPVENRTGSREQVFRQERALATVAVIRGGGRAGRLRRTGRGRCLRRRSRRNAPGSSADGGRPLRGRGSGTGPGSGPTQPVTGIQDCGVGLRYERGGCVRLAAWNAAFHDVRRVVELALRAGRHGGADVGGPRAAEHRYRAGTRVTTRDAASIHVGWLERAGLVHGSRSVQRGRSTAVARRSRSSADCADRTRGRDGDGCCHGGGHRGGRTSAFFRIAAAVSRKQDTSSSHTAGSRGLRGNPLEA